MIDADTVSGFQSSANAEGEFIRQGSCWPPGWALLQACTRPGLLPASPPAVHAGASLGSFRLRSLRPIPVATRRSHDD